MSAPAICGRRPLHGTGDVWCVLPPRHVGLHAGDGGESFIRAEPGVRVGHLVATERRTSSRRRAPQVGKAGDLPPAGRRGADRRAGRGGRAVSFTDSELTFLTVLVDEWCGGTTLATGTARSALRKLRKAGGVS